jgi:LmbE family N-acetylglucosaminyl deacetylase
MIDLGKQGPKVLAIHAHPDDAEFTCAGTLALLAERGCLIVIATLSPGDLGSTELTPRVIAGVRRREAQRSASMLGAPYACLEFHDFCIYVDDESNRRVTEFLRGVRPDVVFAPSPEDYMADHENTSALVRNACFYASVPNYTTRPESSAAAPTERVPALYYCDPVGGKDVLGRPIRPMLLVDISKTIETKSQMLACHESQRDWLRRQHGVDQYVEEMKSWAAERGRMVACEFAEGFRQHLGHAFPTEDVLGSLLGSLVHHLEETPEKQKKASSNSARDRRATTDHRLSLGEPVA